MTMSVTRHRSTVPLIILGGMPKVNLLPPAVRRRQGERRNQRFLGIVIVAVLAGVAVAGGVANQDLKSEQLQLARLKANTSELLGTERDYSAAATTSIAATQITTVQSFVAKTDILWVPFLEAVAAAVAPDGQVTSSSSVSAVSWVAVPVVVVPLAQASVATSSIVISFESLGGVQSVVSRLLNIPGVLAATPGSITKTGRLYSTTISLTIGPKLLSGRFSGGLSGGSR